MKEVILLKDDNAAKKKFKKEACHFNEFPLKKFVNRFEKYFTGEPVDFDVDCDLSSYTPLEKRILAAVKNIPHGITMAYSDIAEIIGDKNLSRAVGRTVAKNLFPIIIPCHRVLGKGGKLTGFSADGGIALKKELLYLECDNK